MSKREKEKKQINFILFGIFIICSIIFSAIFILAATPTGPLVNSTSNSTKAVNSATFFNISGGYIAALNLTATVQNYRWKAFVGWVNGEFTLDDSGGSTIYDWSLSVTTGRVYSTRDSGTIEWSSVVCANRTTNLGTESLNMFHNITAGDNVNTTFNYPGTHDLFWVAGRSLAANSCPTLNTYVANVTQDSVFEEMALYDLTSIIYATILENNVAGYNGQAYDFQMLVPENGSLGFTGATAYYLYVELD
jgi:hypothetical protein